MSVDATAVLTGGQRLLQRPTGRERRRARMNRMMRVVAGLAAIVTIAPLLAIIGFVLARGLPTLTLQFLQYPAANPDHPGAHNAIAGSLQMVPVALLISGGLG